ncbi:conjugal transfer protein TraD [Brevundimonas diminuta]|uniref:conjugal transfer protein TraD n=1 Tax=Brevundimonas diminuta TaxID=293 RepID=UPI00168B991F|nr:conjugal transfer protein TraD [Brevundimonas diminuta]MBD3574304.1 conjugal transfer protein TraD [Brevundimonas diminuta]
MRKPRDIDAELAALAERAAALKARRVTQLGELVIASGADALGADILMGALSAAATETNDQTLVQWRQRGEAFFRGERTRAAVVGAPDHDTKAGSTSSSDAPG